MLLLLLTFQTFPQALFIWMTFTFTKIIFQHDVFTFTAVASFGAHSFLIPAGVLLQLVNSSGTLVNFNNIFRDFLVCVGTASILFFGGEQCN